MSNIAVAVIGVLLLFGGLYSVGFSIGYYHDCQTTASQIAQQVNSTLAQQCQLATLGTFGGGTLAVIGLILAIVGAFIERPVPPATVSYAPQPPLAPIQAGWLCAGCRMLNSSPTGAPVQYCQHCGMQHMFAPPPPPR